MKVQITARHCDVPDEIIERTEELVTSLAKYSPRATLAEVVYMEEKLDKVIEAIVHIDGGEPIVARASDPEYLNSLDKVVSRLGRMLRKERERRTDHQAPTRWERAGQG